MKDKKNLKRKFFLSIDYDQKFIQKRMFSYILRHLKKFLLQFFESYCSELALTGLVTGYFNIDSGISND